MNKIIYADHAATTFVKSDVLNAILPYFTQKFGNASSVYSLGRESKGAVENARVQVANALNARPEEIYFTAGGTESDNIAIRGLAKANSSKNHIITSAIEHPGIINTCKIMERDGYEVSYLPVDKYGKIDLKQLEDSIKPNTLLVSIMFANNEIGTIQPVQQIGEICRRNKVLFHTDAVQAIGNIKIDVNRLNIDLLSMSAHKFYGPKGVGALFVRNGIKFNSIISGGHQEKNKRAGTENVPGIVGLGKAIELANLNLEKYNEKLLKLRNKLVNDVTAKIPEVILNGHPKDRLPGNANFSFKYIEGESLLLMLDMKGICASSGSACTSGALDPSHVLLAIGLPHEIAHGSLRLTFGEENTEEDVDYIVNSLIEIVEKLRRMSPLYNK